MTSVWRGAGGKKPLKAPLEADIPVLDCGPTVRGKEKQKIWLRHERKSEADFGSGVITRGRRNQRFGGSDRI